MSAKNLISIKEKRQFFPFVYKHILGWGAAAIVSVALARYGNVALLKLIGSSLEYKTEAAFFLLTASFSAVVWIFNILKKREQAAKRKRLFVVAGVVGVCALGLYALSKKSPK